jgi:hypothetical protein
LAFGPSGGVTPSTLLLDGYLIGCAVIGLQHLAEVLHIVALAVLLRQLPDVNLGVVALNGALQEGLARLFVAEAEVASSSVRKVRVVTFMRRILV